MGLQGYQGHVPEQQQHMQMAAFNQRANQDYSKM